MRKFFEFLDRYLTFGIILIDIFPNFSLKQILLFARLFYNRMEEWIVVGVKRDNDSTYEMMKKLKKVVHEGIPTKFEPIWVEPISTVLQPYYAFVEQTI